MAFRVFSVLTMRTALDLAQGRLLGVISWQRVRSGQKYPSLTFIDIAGKAKLGHLLRRFPMGMNINLAPQLEQMIRQKVNSGMYNSASEVVRDALRFMDEKDRLRAAKLDHLRQELQEGLSSGPASASDRGKIKRKGRVKRAAKSRTGKT